MSGPTADNLPLPAMPDIRFPCIAIDPPWHFRSRAPSQNPHIVRTPQRHYPTMDLEHIARIPMRDIATADAHVMMWITGPLLAQGVHLRLFKAWGVRASSMGFVWIKLWNGFDTAALATTPLLQQDIAIGTGFTTRQNAEYVIFGRIGSPVRARADIGQVIVSPRREHSRKPEEFFRRVEHYCHGPRIDMFGGAHREGWTHWGWGHREGEADSYHTKAFAQ